jgi:hypothetical protein
MKQPKIDWPNKAEKDDILAATGMTEAAIEKAVADAIRQGQVMAKRGVDMIAPILNKDRSTWEGAWNRNSTLTKWFGKVTMANHVKDVHRRLDTACDRLANKVQTVKVRAELPHDYHAQNLGGPLSKNTWKVAPAFLTMGLNDRGAVTVHEQLHDDHVDQKIDGETVYGSALALRLAREDPGKARRSPENYEQYVRDLQAFHEAFEAKKASGSTPLRR